MVNKAWLGRLSLRALTGARETRATVGITVSANRIAAVRVRTGTPLPLLQEIRQAEVSPHALGDVVRDLADGAFLDKARIILILGAGKYETIAVATPPSVPDDELKDALRWQLRGSLSYPPEDAALDFIRLPHGPAPAGAATAAPLMVVAARRREVSRAVQPFQAAGIDIDAVDIPEMAQHNLLPVGQDLNTCGGLLTFDDSSALLTVQLGDELCFARRMPLPGAGGLGNDEPEHVADRIAINVQRSLEVFARQTSLPEVARLQLGPHPHAPLIARAIREHADIASALFELHSVVDVTRSAPAAVGIALEHMNPEILIALGAALRHDQRRSSVTGVARALPAWLQSDRKAA